MNNKGQLPWNKNKKLGKYSSKRCKNISIALTGRKLSSVHIKHISEGLIGKKRKACTTKTKCKISKSLKKAYRSGKIVNANIGRILTIEQKIKISKNRKNKCMGEDNPSKRLSVRKKISNALKGRVLTKEWKEKIKLARVKQILPTKDTSIEIKLQKELEKRNIKFEKHKSMLGQPDIFIEPNICIFADGDYWHTRPESVIRDKYVNLELKKQGYKILRFWEHNINNNIANCVAIINNDLYK